GGEGGRPRGGSTPQTAERSQRRGRVAACTAQSGLQRNPFGQMNRHVARAAPASRGLPDELRSAPDQIAGVRRAIRVVARQLKRTASRTDRDRIVQRDRLKHGAKIVEPIATTAKNFQRSVDL